MTDKQKIPNLNEFITPLMIDPSLLVSKKHLDQLLDYEGKLFFPSSFLKVLSLQKQREYSGDYEFYCGYLRHRSQPNEIENLISKQQLNPFSAEDIEKYPNNIEPLVGRLKKVNLPETVINILEEELLFLYIHSGLISRIKRIFEPFADIGLPLIDLTKSTPDDWRPSVKGMKNISNWMAFLVDLSMTANLLHASAVTLGISGVRMIIIDP